MQDVVRSEFSASLIPGGSERLGVVGLPSLLEGLKIFFGRDSSEGPSKRLQNAWHWRVAYTLFRNRAG